MAVKIMRGGLTIGLRVYQEGEVIDNPSDRLLAVARNPRRDEAEEIPDETPEDPAPPAAVAPVSLSVGSDEDLPEGRTEDAPDDPPRYTAEALGELTRDQLREIAKGLGADVAGNAAKAVFIDAILAKQAQEGEG
jgi:hypothetical protein